MIMRLLLRSAFRIALCLPAAAHCVYGQVSIPRIASYSVRPGEISYSVWPQKIPVGSIDIMLEVRGNGFVSGSVIQLDDHDIPTKHTLLNNAQIALLTGLVPQSFLAVPKAIAVRVINPDGSASIPVTIEVKPRTQPARLEIELSTVSSGPRGQIDLTIRLTNEGTDSFYVPTRITPFTGGNMLNSYHFEVRRPNDSVFTDAIGGYADGFFQHHLVKKNFFSLAK